MITTHLSVLVDFYDKLDQHRSTYAGAIGVLEALSTRLEFSPDSFEFAKAVLFVYRFGLDTLDSIKMSSIKDSNKDVILNMVRPLVDAFTYPYRTFELPNSLQQTLSSTTRSHIDLVNDIMIREVAFLTPTQEQIDENLREMEKLKTKFHELDLSPWIKDDFDQTINLHIALLSAFPEMSHRVLFETQKTLSSYLSLSLSTKARRVLVAGVVAVNALITAFIIPSEAYEAGKNYYGWILESSTGPSLLSPENHQARLPPPNAVGGEGASTKPSKIKKSGDES